MLYVSLDMALLWKSHMDAQSALSVYLQLDDVFL